MVFDYQVIKGNQDENAELIDFTGEIKLCIRVQISLPLLTNPENECFRDFAFTK